MYLFTHPKTSASLVINQFIAIDFYCLKAPTFERCLIQHPAAFSIESTCQPDIQKWRSTC